MSDSLAMSITINEYNSLSAATEDASILLPIVNDFFTRCIENGETQKIVDSVDASVCDTGIDFHETLSALERMGLPMDPTWFDRDYNVTFVVPVTVTVMVEAATARQAEEGAISELDANGVEAYMMDYSVHYDAEITEVTEV
jgi:hypothetical protein